MDAHVLQPSMFRARPRIILRPQDWSGAARNTCINSSKSLCSFRHGSLTTLQEDGPKKKFEPIVVAVEMAVEGTAAPVFLNKKRRHAEYDDDQIAEA